MKSDFVGLDMPCKQGVIYLFRKIYLQNKRDIFAFQAKVICASRVIRHAERASNFREMNEVIISPPRRCRKLAPSKLGYQGSGGRGRRGKLAMKSDLVG